MATLRPSLFSRWLTQPTELLLRTTRANPLRSQQLSLTLRPKFSAGAPRTRSFNVLARRTRPTHLQPRQRTTRPTRRRTSTNSSSSSSSSSNASAKEDSSLSQRLRTLSREYGWAALGVYLGLSALDFPFCFVAVRLLGVERIGHWEHVVVSSVKDVVKSVWPQAGSDSAERSREAEEGAPVSAEEKGNMEEASIWTQLALAYAVHKSLIFFRVPLTAAVTPKIVKVLRRWGWDIGKRKPKSG